MSVCDLTNGLSLFGHFSVGTGRAIPFFFFLHLFRLLVYFFFLLIGYSFFNWSPRLNFRATRSCDLRCTRGGGLTQLECSEMEASRNTGTFFEWRDKRETCQLAREAERLSDTMFSLFLLLRVPTFFNFLPFLLPSKKNQPCGAGLSRS